MSEEFRERLRTSDERGHRIWVYADIIKGPWYYRRQIVAYLLIVFYFALPWLTVNGNPVFQADIFTRRLTLWGHVFWPHELGMFVPSVVGSILFFFAFTAWVGRLFCGWICPQTVYLEFLYRPIEHLIEGKIFAQKKLNELPFFSSKRLPKKIIKFVVFAILSFAISNTFFAVMVGAPEMLHIMTQSPADHPGMFAFMLIIFGGFMFNFGWFREQMCTITCPYGRMQSVLLDRRSKIVAYDSKRGEPRGRRNGGDCVACNLCVQVCPTGIDIRDGLQMECVNCTACMDACDRTMLKFGMKPKLIAYRTEEELAGETAKGFRVRPLVYVGIGILLWAITIAQLFKRAPIDVTFIRKAAVQFTVEGDVVHDHLSFVVGNKSGVPRKINISTEDKDLNLIVPLNDFVLNPEQKMPIELFANLQKKAYVHGVTRRTIRFQADGEKPENIEVTLFGPEVAEGQNSK